MKRLIAAIMTILFISGYFCITYLFDTNEDDVQVLIIFLMYIVNIVLAILVFRMNKHRKIDITETLQYVILLGILLINIGVNIEFLTNIVSVALIIWGTYINFVLYKISEVEATDGMSNDDLLIKKLSDKGLYYNDEFVKKIRILRRCEILYLVVVVASVVPVVDLINRFGTTSMLYVAFAVELLFVAILVYYRDMLFNVIRPVKVYEYIVDILAILAAHAFIYYQYAFVYESTGIIVFNDIFLFVIIAYPVYMKSNIISKIYPITRM